MRKMRHWTVKHGVSVMNLRDEVRYAKQRGPGREMKKPWLVKEGGAVVADGSFNGLRRFGFVVTE